jgi:polysaccharide biosynthesis transport protein
MESQNNLAAQIKRYSRTLLKWKWTILIVLGLACAGATLFAFLTTPIFTAKGSIWIEDEPKILPFDEIQTFSPSSSLTSHTRLLQSRVLAAETIEKLKLYENPAFSRTAPTGQPSFATLDPVLRERLLEAFLKNLSVTQFGGTRLVEVGFSGRDPKIAAQTLNALFEGFINLIIQKRYADSEQAVGFLSSLIENLQAEIGDREKKLVEYGSQRNILPPSATEAPTVSRMAEFNKALTDATIERINKYNYYNQIRNAPLGEISNPPNGSLFQTLRGQYSQLSREYTKRLTTIRPEYPEMQRLKSELDAATAALVAETENIVHNAQTDYQAALQKEQSFQKQLDDLKNEALRKNSDSIQYNGQRIELEGKKTLLTALLRRQSETGVSSQLKGQKGINFVWIVDKAEPPLVPAYPKKKNILLMGLLIGLVGGLGLAIIFESLTQTISTSKDVTRSIALPALGVIPTIGAESKWKGSRTERARFLAILRGGGAAKVGKKDAAAGRDADKLARGPVEGTADADRPAAPMIELISAEEPKSIQAEGFRSLRTTLLISSPPSYTSTILFTSALAKEGKSTVVANLAFVMAQGGKRIVIVDADLRKPRQHRIFKIDEGQGLTHYLSSHIDLWNVVKPTQFANLSLVKSGPIPANPMELLASEKMVEFINALKPNFDFIFLDTPPVLAVSDVLALGPLADVAVIVARGGQTPIPALKRAKDKLDAHKIKCLGVVLNDVDLIEEDGYYAREYYHYASDVELLK